METFTNNKAPLYALGYVANKETFIDELRSLIGGGQQIDWAMINQAIVDNGVEYLNGAGYTTTPDGKPVDSESAKYERFKVPFNKDGEQVIGWFTKEKSRFTGVYWGTISDFEKVRIIDNRFNMGAMYFEQFWDGSEFLEDIMGRLRILRRYYEKHHSRILEVQKQTIRNQSSYLKIISGKCTE